MRVRDLVKVNVWQNTYGTVAQTVRFLICWTNQCVLVYSWCDADKHEARDDKESRQDGQLIGKNSSYYMKCIYQYSTILYNYLDTLHAYSEVVLVVKHYVILSK